MATISILDYQEDDNLHKTKWDMFCGTTSIYLFNNFFLFLRDLPFIFSASFISSCKILAYFGENLSKYNKSDQT